MVLEFDLGGVLDPERFQVSFNSIVDDSDALRSVFFEHGGMPKREVKPAIDFRLPLIDLGTETDPYASLRLQIRRGSAQSFALDQLCFDSALFKIADDRFVWWFCQHHLIGDGSSIALLFQHLSERYETPESGRPIGSAHEAYRQERAYLRSTRAAQDEKFWTPRRARSIELPRYYSSPRIEKSPHTVRIATRLSADQTAGLRRLATELGIPAMPDLALSSVFATLLLSYLYRISGIQEQALGTALRNRLKKRAKNAVGCFVEMLPYQVDIEHDDTFSALFERVQAETIAVLTHGQHCASNPTDRPLFDVLFNFHTETYPAFAGLPTQVTFSTGLNAYDPTPEQAEHSESLTFQVNNYADDGHLELYFDFRASAFDREQRQRATEHFLHLLDAMILDPHAEISKIDILSPDERRFVVHTCNNTRVEIDRHSSFITRFESQSLASPNALALRFEQHSMTYGELNERANGLANVLIARGIRQGQGVALFLDRTASVLVSMLAVTKAGGYYIPLDPAHPRERNERILQIAAPAMVLTNTASQDTVPATARHLQIVVDTLPPPENPADLSNPCIQHHGEHPAYVIFTSGSTGEPKGVEISHGALHNFLESMRVQPGIVATDRMLALTTVSFDIAALELYLPLLVGASIEMISSMTASDPRLLARVLDQANISIAQATPATWRILLDSGWHGRPGLKVLCGGEAMIAELAQPLAERVGELWNMYGPTETTVWSTTERIEVATTMITIGRPIQNTTAYVVNRSLCAQPIGIAGELVIGGNGLAHGYLGRDDLTSERFIADPFSTGDGRIYRTGDVARRLPDGRIQCLGRTDSQVKIRGFRIELGEIEAAIAKCSNVATNAVLVHENSLGGRSLVAYIEWMPDGTHDISNLRMQIQGILPSYMIPSSFVVQESMPLTHNNKIDRRALADLAPCTDNDGNDAHGNDDRTPRTPAEELLQTIWARVLSIERPGIHQNFYEIGGDSLQAVRIIAAAHDAGLQTTPLQFFRTPTIAELAENTTARRVDGAKSDSLVALRSEGDGAPLFLVHSIPGDVIGYAELLAAMAPGRPIYAFQSIGLSDPSLAHSTVEAMAAHYVEVMRRLVPEGPFHLGGWCFGGNVALEMACQLHDAGDTVDNVILLESYPRRAPNLIEKLRKAKIILKMGHAGLKLATHAAKARLRRAPSDEAEQAEAVHQLSLASGPFKHRRAVYEANVSAIEANRTRDYSGRLTLIKSAHSRTGLRDPDYGWSSLVPQVQVFEFEIDHTNMLQSPAVDKIAHCLDELLSGASPEVTSP